jgi:hypothetical protein
VDLNKQWKMSKAEEAVYKAYIRGYHQAEKDLALTWEDVKLIWNITDEMDNMPEEEFYQEVLKRFNTQKGKRNDKR